MAKKAKKDVAKARVHLVGVLERHQQRIERFKQKSWPERHRAVLRGVGFSALLALFVGIGLCLFVSQYSLVRVAVADVGVGPYTSVSTLQNELDQQVATYKVTVAGNNQPNQRYSLAEVGVSVDTAASAQTAVAAKRPDNILKRLVWWRRQTIALKTKTDDTVMQAFIQNHATQTVAPAKNATVAVNNGVVSIVDEQAGDGYTFHEGSTGLLNAIANLQTAPLVLQKQTLQPNITRQNAQPVADKITKLLAQDVVFTINGRVITAKPADIGGWLDISPSEAQHTIDYSVNSGKVLSYLNRIAKPYVTPPVTQITMPDGTILIPGQNGVDITNKESTAADIAQKVMNGQPVSQDLPVRFAAFKTLAATPHDKWLVVDTTTKRMYAYEQTNMVKSFLISAGAPQTPTVTGEFHIYSKFAVQDMRGANADGSRYFQPHVRWINYFYGDYAIHGNYWRPVSYFGNINSSHGCVGILEADALWVYNWAPIGTTVIVHR